MRKMCLNALAIAIVLVMALSFNAPSSVAFAAPAPQTDMINISGYIRDPQGQPLSGVTLNYSSWGFWLGSTTTGPDGFYSISINQDEVYLDITPSLDGYAFTPGYLFIDLLGTYEDVTDANFTAEYARVLTGTVTSPDTFCTTSPFIFLEPVAPYVGPVASGSTIPGSNAFLFSGLAPVIYNVNFDSDGCEPWSGTIDLSGSDQNIEIPTERINYSVSGRITTPGGIGIAATVRALGTSQTGDPINISVDTDASGEYLFDKAFTWHDVITLQFEPETYAFTPASIALGQITGDVTGQNSTGVLKTYTVAGTVIRALNGVPLAGATLSANGQEFITGDNGQYMFANVVHGTEITITPSLAGFTFLPAQRTITVTANFAAGDAATQFTAVPNGSISGRVTYKGSGLAGVTVTFGTYSTTTAADGGFTLLSIPPGTEADLVPTLAGYVFTPMVQHITMPAVDVDHAPNLGLLQEFTARKTYSIKGKVVGKDGVTPLPGVSFTFGMYSAISGSDGKYTITGIPEDTTADLTPLLPGYRFEPQKTSLTITKDLALSTPTKGIRTFQISGQVIGAASGAGIKISLGKLSTWTTLDGSFVLWADEGTSGSLTPGKEGYHFLPEKIAISKLNADLPGQTFAIAPNQYVLSGKIKNGGKPLAGFDLQIYGSDGSTAMVTTNKNGYYKFSAAVYGISYTLVPNSMFTGYSVFPVYHEFPVKAANQKFDFSAYVYRRTVFGSVMTPLGAERIRVYYGSGASNYVYTNSDGFFSIPNVAGNRAVVIRPVSNRYVFQPEFFEVPVGNYPITGAGFSAIPSSVLSGKVTVAGKPVADATVQVEWLATKTDANGNYRMQVPQSLAPIGVLVTHPYFTFAPRTVITQSNVGLNFTSATVLVSGTVLDADKEAVTIGLVRASADQFAAVMPDGSYSLVVHAAPGVNLWDFSVRVDTMPGFHSEPGVYRITPKNKNTQKNFDIRLNAWSVRGRITYKGSPLAGVTVADTNSGISAVSDSQGYYRIRGLLFGDVIQLFASKKGYSFSTLPEFLMLDGDVKGKDFTASK